MPRWVIKQMYEAMHETPIPKEELELFKQLKDLEIIFDVGARMDRDYAIIYPNAKCHLFEPNPEYHTVLAQEVKDARLTNVVVNPFGMSDQAGEFHYDPMIQSFRDNKPEFNAYPVKTIDWYCKENKIKKIDFLKTDTEGWDLKVIIGARDMWPKIKYIQYEHWNDDEIYRKVLRDLFECEYIGYRNGLCMNKTLVSEEERTRLVKYIRDNKLGELQ